MIFAEQFAHHVSHKFPDICLASRGMCLFLERKRLPQKNWGISVFILNLESLLWVAFTGLFKGRLKCETAHQEDSRFYFLFYQLVPDRISLSKGVSPLSTCLFAPAISSVLKVASLQRLLRARELLSSSQSFFHTFPWLCSIVWLKCPFLYSNL